jgi:acyl dehydratase
MSAPRIVGLDELPGLVGLTFEGYPVTVTRAERNVFDAVTHVIEAYPEADPVEFGPDIVEGFHTLALLDAICSFVMRFDPATTYAYNYGLDRVRFTSPVLVGTELQSTVETTDVERHGEGYKVLRRVTVRTAGSASPSLIADWWVLVLPQGTDQSGLVSPTGD